MDCRYVVFMRMGHSHYQPINSKGVPRIYKSLEKAMDAIRHLIKVNRLLPHDYDYIIFRDLEEENYPEL